MGVTADILIINVNNKYKLLKQSIKQPSPAAYEALNEADNKELQYVVADPINDFNIRQCWNRLIRLCPTNQIRG